MEAVQIKDFFMWCTIINVALLLFSSFFCVVAANWIFSIHSKLFSISRDAFNVLIYSYLAVYKILIIVFCIVPYAVLVILG